MLVFGGLSQNPMSDEGQFFFVPAVKTLLGHSVGVPIDLSTPDVFCLSSNRHPESPGHREERVVVKPNTAGGSVGGLGAVVKKWSRTAILYTTCGSADSRVSQFLEIKTLHCHNHFLCQHQ